MNQSLRLILTIGVAVLLSGALSSVRAQTGAGGSYISPTYGYSLEWDDTWDADEPTNVGGRDFLRLRQPGIKAELIGETWDASIGTCFDWVARDYSLDPPYSKAEGTIDDTSSDGVITGLIEVTYTNQSDQVTTDYVIDILCAPIPSQESRVVILKQTVKTVDRADKELAVAALQDGFSLGGDDQDQGTPSTGLPTAEPTATLAPIPTSIPETPTSIPTPSPSPTAQPASLYVSPTYGYGLSWDETWQIVGEWSEGGVDYLGLETDALTANLYGEPWDPTIGTCFDWYVNYYANAQGYSNVAGIPEPTAEDGSVRGIVTLVYTDPSTGGTLDLTVHVLCSPVSGNPSAVVTLGTVRPDC